MSSLSITMPSQDFFVVSESNPRVPWLCNNAERSNHHVLWNWIVHCIQLLGKRNNVCPNSMCTSLICVFIVWMLCSICHMFLANIHWCGIRLFHLLQDLYQSDLDWYKTELFKVITCSYLCQFKKIVMF